MHPMAGSEQRGINKASASLFKGASCILTRTGKTDMKALRKVSGFWKALGSRMYVLSPAEHDKSISSVSHLPHVAASALSLAAKPSSLIFAASGFKDTTRIAAGDPNLWTSILLANHGNITADIRNYIRELKKIHAAIIRKQKPKLKKILTGAKKKRDMLNR